MEQRIITLNAGLKTIDRGLYAERQTDGPIFLYRRADFSGKDSCFVMALTENWMADGVPCDWGLEVIRARLRAMDLWRDKTIVDELLETQEKREASDKRAFRNNVESFLLDFRREFAKATDSVNTSLLPKIDKRRLANA